MYGWRARIGIIYGVGFTDHEFYQCCPEGVSVAITRARTMAKSMFILGADETPDGFVTEIEYYARELAKMKPATILWGSTSGSFAAPDGGSGRAWDERLKKAMFDATGIASTTTSSSVIAALKAIGARKVVIASPYKPEGEQKLTKYLNEHGIEVLKTRGLACEDVWEIGQLGPEVAYRAAIEAMDPRADAIVIGETSFRTIEILDALEADTGKPVVAASIASMWNSIRMAGVGSKVPGIGRLWREF